jgi:hypothetical protein
VTFTLTAANELVATDLAAAHAATATDLVPGAPPRALVVAQRFSPPRSNSALIVVIGLAPGAPGHLLVPTAMEYLRYTITIGGDGSATITTRPDRADLVRAVTTVLNDEARAFDAAEAALVRARVTLPPGMTAWREAIRDVTYDSRLPAAQFGVVAPSWSFIFEPRSDTHGYNQVLLNDRLGVQMINGRAP